MAGETKQARYNTRRKKAGWKPVKADLSPEELERWYVVKEEEGGTRPGFLAMLDAWHERKSA